MMVFYIALIILVVVLLVVGISLSLSGRQGDEILKKALDEMDSQGKTGSDLHRNHEAT
jgi:hypothetical protein